MFNIRVVIIVCNWSFALIPILITVSILILPSFIYRPEALQPAGGWREGACGMGANQGETGSNLLQCFTVPSMYGFQWLLLQEWHLAQTTTLFHLESLPTSRHWNLDIEETSAASPTDQQSYQLRVNLCMVAAVLLPASSYKLNPRQVLVSSIVACGSIWVQRRPQLVCVDYQIRPHQGQFADPFLQGACESQDVGCWEISAGCHLRAGVGGVPPKPARTLRGERFASGLPCCHDELSWQEIQESSDSKQRAMAALGAVGPLWPVIRCIIGHWLGMSDTTGIEACLGQSTFFKRRTLEARPEESVLILHHVPSVCSYPMAATIVWAVVDMNSSCKHACREGVSGRFCKKKLQRTLEAQCSNSVKHTAPLV